jgi:hypothetical protein
MMITRGPFKAPRILNWALGIENNPPATDLTSSQPETNPPATDLTSSHNVVKILEAVRFGNNNDDQISTSTLDTTESTQSTEINDLTTTLNKILKGCHKK